MAELIEAKNHNAKCQPTDSGPHSYRIIAIKQQDSLRTAGRTYTGPRH